MTSEIMRARLIWWFGYFFDRICRCLDKYCSPARELTFNSVSYTMSYCRTCTVGLDVFSPLFRMGDPKNSEVLQRGPTVCGSSVDDGAVMRTHRRWNLQRGKSWFEISYISLSARASQLILWIRRPWVLMSAPSSTDDPQIVELQCSLDRPF